MENHKQITFKTILNRQKRDDMPNKLKILQVKT